MLSLTLYPAANKAGTQTVRGRCSRQHQAGKGAGERDGQHMRTLDKRRDWEQAEDALRDTERLEPKGNGASVGGSQSPTRGRRLAVIIPTLPANREGLNYSVTHAEHGKPVSLLCQQAEVGRP